MAKSSYAYDLSALEKSKLPEKKIPNLRVIKTSKKTNLNKKSKSKLVTYVVIIFAMFMVISYRCNVISEKNLEVQKLDKTLMSTKGVLAGTEIKLDKAVDMSKVESYSKGQLGMQKPEKSQIVYVNVQNAENLKIFKASDMFEKISNFVKPVFNK